MKIDKKFETVKTQLLKIEQDFANVIDDHTRGWIGRTRAKMDNYMAMANANMSMRDNAVSEIIAAPNHIRAYLNRIKRGTPAILLIAVSAVMLYLDNKKQNTQV